jgi:hypothetical protein
MEHAEHVCKSNDMEHAEAHVLEDKFELRVTYKPCGLYFGHSRVMYEV